MVGEVEGQVVTLRQECLSQARLCGVEGGLLDSNDCFWLKTGRKRLHVWQMTAW